MTRATILARQRAARDRRARSRGDQFQDFLVAWKRHGVPVDGQFAYHIGRLVQRVGELEARVARLEGKR